MRVEVRLLVVLEGGSVLLECACKADPPVTTYRWSYGRTVALDAHTHASTTQPEACWTAARLTT